MEYLAFIGFMCLLALFIFLIVGGIFTVCEVWESSRKINSMETRLRILERGKIV